MARREILLDVSGLEPPEPLVRTVAAAERLRKGEYLRMLHRRGPCLLRDNLTERGFGFHVRPGRQAAVETLVWRKDDPEGERLAAHAAGEPPL